MVDTPLGLLCARACGTAGACQQGKVDALVRPELLFLRPDAAGNGRVVLREFRGHDIFYRVQLDDGTALCAQRPSTEDVPLGARVAIELQAEHVPVFARPAPDA